MPRPEQQPIHDITYWEKSGIDDDSNDLYHSPKTIRGRFIYAIGEPVDGQSQRKRHDVRITDTEVKIPTASIVTKGLGHLTENPDNVYRVVTSLESSDIKGKNTRFTMLADQASRCAPKSKFNFWLWDGSSFASSVVGYGNFYLDAPSTSGQISIESRLDNTGLELPIGSVIANAENVEDVSRVVLYEVVHVTTEPHTQFLIKRRQEFTSPN